MCDVVEAVDGPICLNVCLVPGKSCERRDTCPAHPVWRRAQHAMLEILRTTTVVDLAGRSEAAVEAAPAALYTVSEARPPA